jgi:hypothetical protein
MNLYTLQTISRSTLLFTRFFPPCSDICKFWSTYLLKIIQSLPADPHTSTTSSRLNWPPYDLNGLVRFAERRIPFSVRVPSHFNLIITWTSLSSWLTTQSCHKFCHKYIVT